MTACSLNVFIILHLSIILDPSHGFEVIQPENCTVNPDGTAFVNCEHTSNVTSVQDVRFYSLSLHGSQRERLCQKGMEFCENVIMHPETPNKYLFIIRNIGAEAMNMLYECEFTLTTNEVDVTRSGTPTRLLPGPPLSAPHSPAVQPHLMNWVVIVLMCLLVLVCVYSCTISSLYCSLKRGNKEAENSTYVEMRKPLRPNAPACDIYCR